MQESFDRITRKIKKVFCDYVYKQNNKQNSFAYKQNKQNKASELYNSLISTKSSRAYAFYSIQHFFISNNRPI